MTTYPNLEKLNALLLKDSKLKLPVFRSQVDPSGRNLSWLKKVLPGNPACSKDILDLLNLPQPELLKASSSV